jgi:hypothetical protein
VLIHSKANAVSHLDNLEFLVDIVPRTVPFKSVKEKTSSKTSATAPGNAPLPLPHQNGEGSSMMEIGQTTLNMNGGNGTMSVRRGLGMNGNGFRFDGATDDGEVEAEVVGNGEVMEGGEEDPDAQLQAENERLEVEGVNDEKEDVEMS